MYYQLQRFNIEPNPDRTQPESFWLVVAIATDSQGNEIRAIVSSGSQGEFDSLRNKALTLNAVAGAKFPARVEPVS